MTIMFGALLVVMLLGVLTGYVPASGFAILLVVYATFVLGFARARGLWPWSERPIPRVEGSRLVQRRGDALILSEIDLTLPFKAECTFHSDRRAFVQVRQGSNAMRFPVPVSSSEEVGHVLRDVLGLQWPPHSRVTI